MLAATALADPVRREILVLLRGGERTAGAIAEQFTISRPAISRHLRVLREAGLVHDEARGRQRVYALDPRPLHELESWLAVFRHVWAQRLDALETEVARSRRDQRATTPAVTDNEEFAS